jgi:hypothetical protein
MQGLGLIEIQRKGRLADVTVRREDGTGQIYAHPGASRQPYFQLPFSYWLDDYYKELALPGKALLLIALTLNDGFYLPAERGPDWYGISASTVERGMRELRQMEIIRAQRVRRIAPLAPEGYTQVNLYTLKAPFGPKRRAEQPQPPAEPNVQA